MGATIWRMIRCGRCPACLCKVRSHGPYPHHFEGPKASRRHLYGEGDGGGGGAAPTEAEKEEMREAARQAYRELERTLSPKQRKKLDDVMGRIAALRRVERAKKRETEKRTGEARSKGLTRRAVERVAREVAEQFEAELAELSRQVAREKKELGKMLRDGGGG